jgi:pilus assembly protein Flp/PilA
LHAINCSLPSDESVQNGHFGCQFRNIASFSFTQAQLYRAISVTLKVIPITEATGQMSAFIRHFFRDERGATAIEYGLIAAGISVAIIAVVQSVGSSLNTTFTSVATALK